MTSVVFGLQFSGTGTIFGYQFPFDGEALGPQYGGGGGSSRAVAVRPGSRLRNIALEQENDLAEIRAARNRREDDEVVDMVCVLIASGVLQ